MKKPLISLMMLLTSMTAAAQPTMLPYEESDTYKCFEPRIGWGTTGAWAYYICDPWKKAPITAKSRITWIASPYPIRLDLIGSRLTTIQNATDKKLAAQKAWTRYVLYSPLEANMWLLKEEMIKNGVPIEQ